MLDIERQPRKAKSIPLVSLIDVVFMLLIYFMLTTSFTRSESMELSLPNAKEANTEIAKVSASETLHIYISNSGETFLERQSLGQAEMSEALAKVFMEDPERGVLVMSANKVSVGVLVKVLDRIYTAGGKNIAVSDWVMNKPTAKLQGGGNG